jgi:O-acetyl-ADP-ribose deacetylase (regulator of RNase III)
LLRYVNSDLFSSPSRVLVNTVNTVGVMGKGIALEFKKRYPAMYEAYRDLCRSGQLSIGKLWLWRARDRWILNFPTKQDWRRPSKEEYVEAGLAKFVASYHAQGIDSVSFPLLGCGNGQLDFNSVVRPLMERYLRPLTIPIYIHLRSEPSTFVPEHKEADLFAQYGIPPLSFRDFWCDVRRVAERNPEIGLETLASGSPFRLAYATDDSVVFMRGEASLVHIPKSDFYDLWIRLRMTGSCSAGSAPGRIGREYGLVFAFLSLLPYIDPIQMSDSYDSLLSRPSTGIQLSYRPTAERPPLAVEYA